MVELPLQTYQPLGKMGVKQQNNMTLLTVTLLLAPIYQVIYPVKTLVAHRNSSLFGSSVSSPKLRMSKNNFYRSSLENDNDSDGEDVVRKLTLYGYLPSDENGVAQLRSATQFSAALRKFQKFANLPQTGRMDRRTRAQFKQRRCGVPDILPNDQPLRRKRFALQGSRWYKTDLTWTLTTVADTLTRQQVYEELRKAFQVWASASVLKFTYVEKTATADIIVSFKKGDHQDGYSFDGNGQVLAHAFFPGSGRGGDAHFDNDERWVDYETSDSISVSLFTVAVHEFGHSLGLSHSSRKDALMYPWYQRFPRDANIPEDDREGLLKLYGVNKDKNTDEAPETPKIITESFTTTERPERGPPNPCSATYDAITVIRGDIFIFSGRYFWRIREKMPISETYATEIYQFWHGLPENLGKIDAIYERMEDGKVVIFIEGQYWQFTGNEADPGFPRSLTSLGLPRIVRSIDAAFVWNRNNKTYLFKDNFYWRINKGATKVDDKYPKDSSAWNGIPSKIDSAFQHEGKTYFFKGNEYWRYDDALLRVVSKVPALSAVKWMPSCWNTLARLEP